MTAALDVLTGWPSQLDELFGRITGEFARAEPRRQARKYQEGLLGGAKRKNGWQLAEQIGEARPWRTQRVLSHVLWDQDRVRGVCRAYIVEQLGRDGVLIVDETGFLKASMTFTAISLTCKGAGATRSTSNTMRASSPGLNQSFRFLTAFGAMDSGSASGA